MKTLWRFSTAFFLVACSAHTQPLKLIPYPRSVAAGQGYFTAGPEVRVSTVSPAAEDHFAAGLLVDELQQLWRLRAFRSARKPHVTIGRLGDRAIDAEIARRGLDTAKLAREQSYLLSVTASGVLLAARSAEGIFYGVQTLRQLAQPDAKGGAVQFPVVTIYDWPALKYRGLSLDVSRGPILTEDQMKMVVRTLAEYKMNMLSFYMEHVFEYAHSPGVTREGGAITPEQMKTIIDYARQYHVELVPQQQTFGHLHHLLKVERYSAMAEIPFGHVLAPVDERGYDWIHGAISQLAALFPGSFVHIGSDETEDLGRGRSREYAKRLGAGNVYMEHMRKVVDRARPLGKRLMFWGDIALSHPELLSKLPKDLVAMTWIYSPKDDFAAYITPFRNLGMDVFVCPGVNNWDRIFPNMSSAVGNINNFVRDGKKLGAIGMLNTHWVDDGEALFNMTWYGVLFGAAASWQEGTVDTSAFDGAFDWAFYRDAGDGFVSAIRKLDQIHALLRSVTAGDAVNELMWFEPFTPSGAERVRGLLPVASQLRLLAEDALVLLNQNETKALLHRDTVPYLRFAARRLDALGLRIQISKAIGDIYRQAQADAGAIRRISGANGLIQDLRESVVELKEMYRKLWLAENRPYWLGNVLACYDREAGYWTGKAFQFAAIDEEYRIRKKLPGEEALGLTLP